MAALAEIKRMEGEAHRKAIAKSYRHTVGLNLLWHRRNEKYGVKMRIHQRMEDY